MKKFTCGHCGGRIAVTPKNLGKLVLCPDCGKPTHPLAGDILAAAEIPKSGPPTPTTLSAELLQRSCENCGRAIGRLEPLQVWDNHLVCPECHDKLAPKPAARVEAKPVKSRSRVKTETLPGLLQAPMLPTAPPAALPVIVERAADSSPAQSTGMTIDTTAIKVAVGRVATVASAAASLPPLKLKHRLLILLGVVCFAGVAIYGALTLLRDLAGLITTLALILLAATAVVLLLKTSVGLVGKWRSMPRKAAVEPAEKPSP